MVATKTPGVIPCAHCRAQVAAETCSLCARQVCVTCVARWQSCDTPLARELRLGMGWRLLDVDRDGVLGLARHMLTRRTRLLDLKRCAWIADVEPPADARLRRDGRAVVLLSQANASQRDVMTEYSVRIEVTNLRRNRSKRFLLSTSSPGTRSWSLSSGGTYVCQIRRDEMLGLIELATGAYALSAPLPGKVIHAAAMNETTNHIVAATFGQVRLLEHTKPPRPRVAFRPAAGDIGWLACTDTSVVVVTRNAAGGEIEVWSTEPPFDLLAEWHPSGFVRDSPVMTAATELLGQSLGEPFNWDEPRGFDASRDGSFVAIAVGKHIRLYDVARQQVSELTGHTDTVNLVRFVAGDSMLVTADRDNRVMVRPRAGGSYLDRAVKVELADAPVAFPEVAAANELS